MAVSLGCEHSGQAHAAPSGQPEAPVGVMVWMAEVGEELRRRGLLRKSVVGLPEGVLDGDTLRTDAK